MTSSDGGLLNVALRGTSFSQTGSWNMVDIGKLVVGLPITLLQRFAGSGVQPYTVLTAEAMGSTFRLSWDGRKRIADALTKLPAAQVISQNLKIGFGIDDVARVIARGEGGMTILALCAALRECYSDDIAVEILLEYARTTKASDSWMPSYLDWRAFLDICAGSLSCSNFSRHAETLMSLCGDCCLRSLRGYLKRFETLRGCSAPQSIAIALFHLAELTNGEITAVTLCGGTDIGWVAAVADWILSLRVAIFMEETNELRWQNFRDCDECQVRILVQSTQTGEHVLEAATAAAADTMQRDSPTMPPTKNQPAARSLMSMNVRETTRRVDFKSAARMFQGDAEFRLDYVVCGRVPWEHALGSTFRSEFTHLMKESHTLGMLLGSSARILQAIVEADEAIEWDRDEWTSYGDASHGIGFVDTVTKYFPELSALRHSMFDGLRTSFTDAVANYNSCATALRKHCECEDCPNRVQSNSFCAVTMAESIIHLCQVLSNVCLLDDSLMPTRKGIELAYDRLLVVERQIADSGSRALAGQFGRAICWLKFEFEHVDSVRRINNGTERRLSEILELFTGRAGHDHTAQSIDDSASAVWANGLTAYLGVLRGHEFLDRNVISKICLSPGRIWFNDKAYLRLSDEPLRHLSRTRKDMSSLTENQLYEFTTAGDTFRRSGLQVKESALGLRCLLDMETNDSRHRPLIARVGPCALAWIMLKRLGNVACKQRSSERCNRALSSHQWTRREQDSQHTCLVKGAKTVHFWQPYSSDHLLAIVSALAATPQEILCSIFIVDQECQDCCLTHASRGGCNESRELFHFIRINNGRPME